MQVTSGVVGRGYMTVALSTEQPGVAVTVMLYPFSSSVEPWL